MAREYDIMERVFELPMPGQLVTSRLAQLVARVRGVMDEAVRLLTFAASNAKAREIEFTCKEVTCPVLDEA